MESMKFYVETSVETMQNYMETYVETFVYNSNWCIGWWCTGDLQLVTGQNGGFDFIKL